MDAPALPREAATQVLLSDEMRLRLIELVELGDLRGISFATSRWLACQAITAEDVKVLVRGYADQQLPGWECGEVSLRVGDIGEMKEETLLVLPIPLPQVRRSAI